MNFFKKTVPESHARKKYRVIETIFTLPEWFWINRDFLP